MISKKEIIIRIPKKIKPFFNKDIDFNISDFVLNKDIENIPGEGNLNKKFAIKEYHWLWISIVSLIFMVPFPIFSFFLFQLMKVR